MNKIVVDPQYTPHWVEGLAAETYHADKTAVNSSAAKHALKSGQDFDYHFHNSLTQTKSMKWGTLAHMAILEGQRFIDSYVVMPTFSGFTKEGKITLSPNSLDIQNQVKTFMEENNGRTILTQKEFDDLRYMIDSVIANNDALKMLTRGKPELTGYFPHPATGVLCRFRLDFLPFDVNGFVDVKTVVNCDIDWFRSNRVEDKSYMYYYQNGFYDLGTEVINKKKADFPVWILIGSEAPWRTIVVPVEETYREVGRLAVDKSLEKIKSCIDKNHWDRPPEIQAMHPSHWFFQKQGELLNG